jgi:short-subunit dehydrogenase
MSTKVAVVTGASSGIGEASARRLAKEPGIELVLVARRAERLEKLASELPVKTSVLPLDLTDDDAPARLRAHVEEHHGRLDLLINNAGASWRATFADGGWDNVHRTMQINFDAVVRVTEALLPLLRSSAPSSIVNVASTAGRVARPGAGSYSASKFALIGWTDALYAEEIAHGVHVGLVLPGFIETEGFPAAELTAKPWTRWTVGKPSEAAQAIIDVGLKGHAERYVPRYYALAGVLRILLPPLARRIMVGAGAKLVTKTGADSASSS